MEEQRSKKKKKMDGVGGSGGSPIKTAQTKHQPITDKRFVHALNDPIFRRVPKSERRVDIDKRFQSMFHDKKFKLKSSVDKRGRPVDFSTDENLRQYYNLVNSDSESEGESIKSEPRSSDAEDEEQSIKSEPSSSGSSESKDEDDGGEIEGNVPESEIKKRSDGVELSKKLRKKLHDSEFDYARGDGVLIKEESSDSSSTSDEEEEGIDNTHAWGELDHDAERTEEATTRLALCNMDWDRLKAVDLMVLFHSFLPAGGVLKSVKIFVSEYGKQRLADEDVNGPMELREIKEEVNSDEEFEPKNEEEDEEGKGFNMEKLRKYQLNRLKYYYAVLDFDSVSTAEKIYTDCDGMEYESSATRVDLRYIPEDMSFDEEPTDSCDSLPSAEKYRPRFFTTTALQQAKVNLTWDETDPLRKELTQKVHNPKEKIDDEDLKAYLATSSSESEVDDEKDDNNEDEGGDTVSKYRSLLELIESQEKKKKEKDVEMEITWGVGLKEKTESLVKKKLEEKKSESLTPWEEILEKRKEKRKSKKKERMKPDEDAEAADADGQMFSDDDVDIDLDDPFFKDEIQSNEIMKQGSKKKSKSNTKNNEKPTKDADNAELELLLMDETEDKKHHFSLKKILDAENEGKKKKKRKNKKDLQKNPPPVDDFHVDVEDSRFSKLFSSHLYNVDPSDPNYKKTKGMEAIISEKQKRRLLKADEQGETPDESTRDNTESTNQDLPEDSAKKLKVSSELSILVKSVKRKTESLKHKDSKR